MISIEIKGLKKFMLEKNKMEARKIKLIKGVGEQVQKFAQSVVRSAKLNYLTGPRPEKLGVVTGRLRASIGFEVEEEGKESDRHINIIFGTDVPYGKLHEEGTSRLKARPFLKPAVQDNIERFRAKLGDLLELVAN